MDKDYYNNKIKESKNLILSLSKKNDRISFARLFVAIVGIIVSYKVLTNNVLYGFIVFVLICVIFFFIVQLHNKLSALKEENEQLVKIYENELITHEDNLFGNGEEFIDNNHPYSSDLDLFGKKSIFNLINRTVTFEGKNILADWMLNIEGNKQIIEKRQLLIKELSKKINFKEQFLSTFFLSKDAKSESKAIVEWISRFKFYFVEKKMLRLLLLLLSLITSISIIFSFVNSYFLGIAFILIAINLYIGIKLKKRVDYIHEHSSKQEKLFKKYSLLIQLIKKEKFKSNHFQELQKKLLNEMYSEKELKILSNYIKNLDYRLNLLLSFPLNTIFFWEIHYCFKIEKWMKKNASKVSDWLGIIGEFDALISLSILHFNNSEWSFPIIKEGVEQYIDTEAMGHPLILKNNRKNNDYKLIGSGKFDIITGSNMAGKSTFLRTIGVNTILALIGSSVCAKSFTITPIKLITYMRVNDSLEDSLSTFHAELNRIKSILDYVIKNENCFLLLDELLRGTNSNDRHIGSVALIKQLILSDATGVIATHDLALTKMQKEFPNNIKNYHFDVKTKNEDLFFDYKLTKGICQSFNASLLMKKIGINIDSL